jgi:WD40 repeat protein
MTEPIARDTNSAISFWGKALRPVEFDALKQKLLDAKGDSVAITAALRGAGGYGKTTLAKALAHDPNIEDAYFDGILWAELGEKPEKLLSIISDLIEILSLKRPALENLNSAAAKLGEALGDRRILLIIDDAWRDQDLRPFLQGGRNTTRLITTRRDDILPLNTERERVDAMAADEALALLSWGLPEDQAKTEKRLLATLGERLGEWAQLLKLVNGFLRNRVNNSHEPLAHAIAGVNKRLNIKGLIAFDSKNEAARTNAIAKTIGVSLDLLDETERARFAELAVFPEDADVPLGVVSRLWSETGGVDECDTEDILQRLQNLSLLLSLDLDRRTFRFHDTVRHFLQEQAGKDALAALHKRLLETVDTSPNADAQAHRYFCEHLTYHLACAGEREGLESLLSNPEWLRVKLSALSSPQSLVVDYDNYAEGELQQLIGRALRLTMGICARDPRQLMPQLIGRLLPFNECEECSRFLNRARLQIVRPALLPVRPSLTPPGAERVRLDGQGGAVRALAVLPDGRLASGSDDGIIRLWDLVSGAETGGKLDGHGGYVNALAVLPDGRLASGSGDGIIRLWDLASGADTRLVGHAGYVNALAVLPDGRLASGSGDRTIRLWGLASRDEKPAILQGHRASVRALAVLSDGRFASGSDDEFVLFWDLSSDAEPDRLPWGASVRAIAPLAGGQLALGSSDNTIRVWDTKSKTEEAVRLEGHRASVNALATLPNGYLASGSDDNTARLWDLANGAETAKLVGHGRHVRALAILPNGYLASGSDDNTVRLWHLASAGRMPRLPGHDATVRALAPLPGGRLASGSDDRSVRLWDSPSGAEPVKLPGYGATVRALALLPDGRLAVGLGDNTIRLWDLASGAETARLEGHVDWVNALAGLPDGRLASGSGDGIIRLWDLARGAEPAEFQVHRGHVNALAVLPDGCLAVGCDDGIVRLWDLVSGDKMQPLEAWGAAVRALALLPEGRLASGSDDNCVRLWDLETGVEAGLLEGHGASVRALAVLPNGHLASGSDDRTIRLWNFRREAEEARLEVDAAVYCLAALSDGHLAAGDKLGRIHWLEIVD